MQHYKNLKLWIYGLLSSVISAGAGAVGMMALDPKDFNLHDGWRKLAGAFGVAGILALANYLQRHPVPELDKESEVVGIGAAVDPPLK